LFGAAQAALDILRLFSKKWMHEKSGRKEKARRSAKPQTAV
jgi:hypothetical protein